MSELTDNEHEMLADWAEKNPTLARQLFLSKDNSVPFAVIYHALKDAQHAIRSCFRFYEDYCNQDHDDWEYKAGVKYGYEKLSEIDGWFSKYFGDR